MALRNGLLLVALAAGLALSTGDSRADRLDNELGNRMKALVEQLKAKYKNVGVLRFRVQEGSQKETHDTPLSGRMADRVETLLITHNAASEADALGVIRDAGATAAGKKIGSWYASPEERKKLFAQKYPLAWGDSQVEADAFVTGKVMLSKDRKTTTVSLEYFSKENPAKLVPLASFDLGTDRFVLRDLGYSFALSRSSREKLTASRSTLKDEEEVILEEVKGSQPPGDDKAAKTAVVRPGDARAEPENIGGIAVEFLVGGKAVDIRPAATAGDAIRWQVESPGADAKVAIRLKNTTDKSLAVVLRLNGVSTINEQKDDPEHAAKWVIRPGKSYLLEGFYLVETEAVTKERGLKVPKSDEKKAPPKEDEEKKEDLAKDTVKEPVRDSDVNPLRAGSGLKLKAFKVLVGEAAKVADLGPKAGHIDVDVFEEGSAKDEEILIAPKGLPPSKEKQSRSSYLGLRSALLKSSKLTTEVVKLDERGGLTTRKEVVVPDKEAFASNTKVKVINFANARLAARLTVKLIAADGVSGDN